MIGEQREGLRGGALVVGTSLALPLPRLSSEGVKTTRRQEHAWGKQAAQASEQRLTREWRRYPVGEAEERGGVRSCEERRETMQVGGRNQRRETSAERAERVERRSECLLEEHLLQHEGMGVDGEREGRWRGEER